MKPTSRGPTDPEAYVELGLGPLPDDADPRDLYLDMVKRAVANILYEDEPVFALGPDRQPMVPDGYHLRRRALGEDAPRLAHTMIGIRRLDNLQLCLRNILADDIPGDILEAGVLRGGATIFARAVLKAHGVTERRVFACDTFPDPVRPPLVRRLAFRLCLLLSYLPGMAWKRSLVRFVFSRARMKMFPDSPEISDQTVNATIWGLRHFRRWSGYAPSGLSHVRSYFARYGLLDDQVTFLKGFFSDTLATPPTRALALLRLDADTFESTTDALNLLYPTLSPGGYCIIDDYHALPDCSRAVDEYRRRHGIDETLVPIDNNAVFWRKRPAPTPAASGQEGRMHEVSYH